MEVNKGSGCGPNVLERPKGGDMVEVGGNTYIKMGEKESYAVTKTVDSERAIMGLFEIPVQTMDVVEQEVVCVRASPIKGVSPKKRGSWKRRAHEKSNSHGSSSSQCSLGKQRKSKFSDTEEGVHKNRRESGNEDVSIQSSKAGVSQPQPS